MLLKNDDLILITGASSGIGRATALKINALGARVVALARSKAKLESVHAMAQNPGIFFIEPYDLGQNIGQVYDFIQSLAAKYGKFSGFVHSAGVYNTMPLMVYEYEKALDDFNVNYFSAMEITKALARKKNKQELLSIVFISSAAANCGGCGASVYAATKAALAVSAKTLTKEIGRNRIRINSILPGNIETDMTLNFAKEIGSDYLQATRDNTPFGEAGKPEYVANLACFLLSRKAYWIQGQSIVIDGAETL